MGIAHCSSDTKHPPGLVPPPNLDAPHSPLPTPQIHPSLHRVRNFLRAEDASLLLLSEYTDSGDAARARAYFRQGRRKILLYTERAQFYNRGRTPGIQVRVVVEGGTVPREQTGPPGYA